MKWDRIESRWKDDGNAMTSTRGRLIGRIQRRYGITREEAGRQVEQWSEPLLDNAEASTTH